MLPAAIVRLPAVSNIRLISSVVVVFPFVPVIATIGHRQYRYANSNSLKTGVFCRRNSVTKGRSGAIPGLNTAKSNRAAASK